MLVIWVLGSELCLMSVQSYLLSHLSSSTPQTLLFVWFHMGVWNLLLPLPGEFLLEAAELPSR